MPRLADHTARRGEITDATRRVIAQRGLEATTFQAVADAAGVSVRLVQYYFGNKEGLLIETHRAVVESSALRFSRLGRDSTPPSSTHDALLDIITALLPLDAARRADAVVLAAFHAAALTAGPLKSVALLAAPRHLVDAISAQLTSLHQSGYDARLDAELMLATVAGLTQSALAGHVSEHEALAIAERMLDYLVEPRQP